MQQEQDSNNKGLSIPSICHCFFDQQSLSYVGVLSLINISQTTIYFHKISTFSQFLHFENNKKSLEAQQKYEAKFKIKSINQIIPKNEFIFISWSKRNTNQYCSVIGSQMSKIQLVFDQQIMEVPEIQSILATQAQQMLNVAENKFNMGDFKAAYNMYEQCFLFYRKKSQNLLGMARSLIQLQKYQQALDLLQLQIFLRPNEKDEAMLMKAQILQQFLNKQTGTKKYELLKTSLDIYCKIAESQTAKKGFKVKSQKGKSRLEQTKQSCQRQQTQHHFNNIIEQAIQNFDQNQILKEYFDSKQTFSNELKNILNNQQKSIEETPQYAIDPIQYQIYRDPIITPNGHSYEKQFLMHFFKQHGHKDPHTRLYLDPHRVVPNITLKILVRNNPNLSKWLKYEEQSCRL